MQPKNNPAGGQWAEQQKIADEKQKRGRQKKTPMEQGGKEEQPASHSLLRWNPKSRVE
jgi:hypothetical protein